MSLKVLYLVAKIDLCFISIKPSTITSAIPSVSVLARLAGGKVKGGGGGRATGVT